LSGTGGTVAGVGRLASRWVPLAVAVAAVSAGVGVAVARRPEQKAPPPVALRSEGRTFRTLPELVDASVVVVLAEVTSVSEGRTFAAPSGGAVRSRVLRLDVGSVLAGPDPGASLAVEEVAELVDGTPVTVDGLAPAEEGDQGFWFLSGPSDRSVPYLAAVGPQGRYLRRSEEPGDDRLVGAAGDDPLVRAVVGAGGRRLADDVIAVARGRGRPVRLP
jgi:hypothetical protein